MYDSDLFKVQLTSMLLVANVVKSASGFFEVKSRSKLTMVGTVGTVFPLLVTSEKGFNGELL